MLREKLFSDPIGHLLEHAFWAVAVGVGFVLIVLLAPTSALAVPAGAILWLYATTLLLGLADMGELVSRFRDPSFGNLATNLLVCVWLTLVWLNLPAWSSVALVTPFRRWLLPRPGGPPSFRDAWPGYMAAALFSAAWGGVAMAHSGFMVESFGAEEGFQFFHEIALPTAFLPVGLMALRRLAASRMRRPGSVTPHASPGRSERSSSGGERRESPNEVSRRHRRLSRFLLASFAVTAAGFTAWRAWDARTRIEIDPYFLEDGSLRGYRVDIRAGSGSLAFRCISRDDETESTLFLVFPDSYVDGPRFDGMTIQFDDEKPIAVRDKVELPFGAATDTIEIQHLWGQLSGWPERLVSQRGRRIALIGILGKLAAAGRVTVTLTSLEHTFVFGPWRCGRYSTSISPVPCYPRIDQ